MNLVLSLTSRKKPAETYVVLLWLLVFIVAAAPVSALAVEKVEPTLQVTDIPDENSNSFTFRTDWETSVGDLVLIQYCSPAFNSVSDRTGYFVFEIASEDPFYEARCSVVFAALNNESLTTLEVMGRIYEVQYEEGEWPDKTRYAIASDMSGEIINQRAIPVEAYTESTNDVKQLLLLPPSEYQSKTSQYVELVKERNTRVARERAIAEERRRKERETGGKIALVIAVAFGIFLLLGAIGICIEIYSSGVIQRGFRKGLEATTNKVQTTKKLYRRRRSFNTAKELSLWVELRDKGEITQEEFERKKRDLME